jgi:hypothetical protein
LFCVFASGKLDHIFIKLVKENFYVHIFYRSLKTPKKRQPKDCTFLKRQGIGSMNVAAARTASAIGFVCHAATKLSTGQLSSRERTDHGHAKKHYQQRTVLKEKSMDGLPKIGLFMIMTRRGDKKITV